MPIQQGMNQQTPAVQSLLRNYMGNGSPRKTRSNGSKRGKKLLKRAKSTGAKVVKKAASRAADKAKRFVKGTPQAKAFMAKLRKMRGKKKA